MSNRCFEPGWELCSVHDRSGRRGIWYRRINGPDQLIDGMTCKGPLVALEVCGGREGDDYYAKFTIGEPVSREAVIGLIDVFETSSWMMEENPTLHGPIRHLDLSSLA